MVKDPLLVHVDVLQNFWVKDENASDQHFVLSPPPPPPPLSTNYKIDPVIWTEFNLSSAIAIYTVIQSKALLFSKELRALLSFKTKETM